MASFSGGRDDRFRAEVPRDLHGRRTDAAGSRVDQHALTGLNLPRERQRVIGGDEQQERCGRLIADPVVERVGQHRARQDRLRVGAAVHERRDPLADLQIAHVLADGADRPHAIEPRHVRRRRPRVVGTAPPHDVREIHPGQPNPDRNLPRPRHRLLALDEPQL
jgi:hypothetical protein